MQNKMLQIWVESSVILISKPFTPQATKKSTNERSF